MAPEGKDKNLNSCVGLCLVSIYVTWLELTYLRFLPPLMSGCIAVALDKGYDKSVDVYSFGILLWEICSLEKPFKGYGSKKHMTNVIHGDERPKMDHHHTAFWPVNLQWLMKSCWSPNPEDRPSFDAARLTLLDVQEELSHVTPERTRARSMGSHEEACTNSKHIHTKASALSPVFEAIKKPARPGGLRVRSLGLKRGNSWQSVQSAMYFVAGALLILPLASFWLNSFLKVITNASTYTVSSPSNFETKQAQREREWHAAMMADL